MSWRSSPRLQHAQGRPVTLYLPNGPTNASAAIAPGIARQTEAQLLLRSHKAAELFIDTGPMHGDLSSQPLRVIHDETPKSWVRRNSVAIGKDPAAVATAAGLGSEPNR